MYFTYTPYDRSHHESSHSSSAKSQALSGTFSRKQSLNSTESICGDLMGFNGI